MLDPDREVLVPVPLGGYNGHCAGHSPDLLLLPLGAVSDGTGVGPPIGYLSVRDRQRGLSQQSGIGVQGESGVRGAHLTISARQSYLPIKVPLYVQEFGVRREWINTECAGNQGVGSFLGNVGGRSSHLQN
uniref:Uncharacterized protein n=1 Tax=Xenopus tropicalis TaxID=8364 RepID=A0A1B8Y3Z2_XENTR